ncbi:MAG: oligosaccharide repeat unit polymerase [Lachnospiraceae bacterium]|nr:oligosaccharide repeat unit polymerase [Lachnospiraceae bacterium]
MENGKEIKSTIRNGFVFAYPVAVALCGGLLCRFVPDSGQWIVSILLILAAFGSYLFYARLSGCLVDLRALLSLSWLFGLGLANLRLSNLHEPWTDTSILSFFGFYALTMLTFEACMLLPQKKEPEVFDDASRSRVTDALYKLIPITSGISFLCFCAEVIKLRYIPLFATFTHAYNYFHVTGLHYFTFSSMFTHALTVLFLMFAKKEERPQKRMRIILIANIISLLIPILCVSKLQFLLVFFYPVMILLLKLRFKKFSDLPLKRIGIAALIMAVVLLLAGFVFTVRRNYPEGYLQGIFDMKDPETPEIAQLLYMYVSNNYANFNHMTLTLTEHTYGLRSAFPIVALTGLKFMVPSLTPPDPDLLKQELSTLSVIYDAYFDFGLVGVLLFSILFGALLAGITRLNERKQRQNPITLLMCAELALYATLSFFDTWFSNPTVWFWFAITILMYIYVEYQRRRGRS